MKHGTTSLDTDDCISLGNDNDDDIVDRVTNIHATDTLRSVNELPCDLPTMKFVFVGDAGTGKTSLLERYINNKFSIAFESTLQIDFKSTELTCQCCNTKYKLYLWDTVGQERYKAITNAYYRDAVGGFVIYDVTQRASLDHCLQWKKEIDDVVQLSNGDPIPIVLIANKIDCGRLDGKQFSKENGFAGYFETSAKTGAGIKEAIHFMVKKVHELSCAHQEPVVETLSRSIKLEFNKDDGRNHKHCCSSHQRRRSRRRDMQKYDEHRSTVVKATFKSSFKTRSSYSKDEQIVLHNKPPNVKLRSAAISQSSKSSSSPSTPGGQKVTTSVHPHISIGEKVMVDTPNGFKFGKVKFVGSTEFAAGEWIGVALERPSGSNDGTVKGVKYFKCKEKHGLFICQDKIIRDPSITGPCKIPKAQSRLLTLSKSSDHSLSSPEEGASLDPPDDDCMIGCVESAAFDETGGKFYSFEHGVTVTVPSGAIPAGVTSEMKFAASLNPPVKLLNDAVPVSAIIWLCMNVVLQKPIILQIPHYVNVNGKAHPENLQFVKNNFHSSNKNKTITAEVIEGGVFPVGESYGMIEITHFCYYCIELIQAKDIPENLCQAVTMKEVQPDIERNLWMVHVCIIPSLPTCLKGLQEQYDKQKWKCDIIVKDFSFVSHDIKFSLSENLQQLCDMVKVKPVTYNQVISKNEVDFRRAYEDNQSRKLLKCKIEVQQYPPRFIFEVSDNTTSGEYFKKRRFLKYILIGGRIGSESNICDEISIPLCPGSSLSTVSSPTTSESAAVNDKLLERPTPQMLSRIKRHFASHWVDVGYELLTTTPEDVETIQRSNKTEHEKCFDMLKKWVETDTNASYSKLIDALNVYDLNIAIEKVIDSITSL